MAPEDQWILGNGDVLEPILVRLGDLVQLEDVDMRRLVALETSVDEPPTLMFDDIVTDPKKEPKVLWDGDVIDVYGRFFRLKLEKGDFVFESFEWEITT